MCVWRAEYSSAQCACAKWTGHGASLGWVTGCALLRVRVSTRVGPQEHRRRPPHGAGRCIDRPTGRWTCLRALAAARDRADGPVAEDISVPDALESHRALFQVAWLRSEPREDALAVVRIDLWAHSRCRGGKAEPTPGAEVAGGEITPGAEVAGVSPLPVQRWQGRAP